MTRKQQRYGFLCLVLLLGGMITLGENQTAHTASVTTPLPIGLVAITQPTPMPTFHLPSVKGTTLRSADLQGKVVVIRFWATW